MPIYEKYTAGGVRSVRGYEFNSLGPLDSEGDAEGGNLQVITSAEIFFPLGDLFSAETFRVGVYFDAGNVYSLTVADYDDRGIAASRSAYLPSGSRFIGPIEFSYAMAT